MEKLTVTNSFNKSIESLKTTECSAKEKLHHFNTISECLTNAHLQNNYQQFISPAISVLILFCEDGLDSTVRMCAYENLIKVLRICEAGQQIRKVMIDLYHEIKKNGNERSLRICLTLFGYLSRHIIQKRSRVYVQNVLPCIHAICVRRETMLQETLSDFLHPFCDHLSLSMTELEVMKLIDTFLTNLTVSCATRRRCMAQNTMTVLERHRKRQNMAAYALNRSTEVLVKNRDEVNTTLGVLGLWRLLIPVCLTEMEETNGQVQEKLLEIFDLSIQYLLSCPNHSVINATLEVLIALTHNVERLPKWRQRLCDNPNDILSKRNSLKMVVCGKETQIISAEDTVIVSMDNDQITLEMIETTTTDMISENEMNPENVSLRSLKSNDSSIGGFFNSLIPTTTDFFKNQHIFPGSSQSTSTSESLQSTPSHKWNNEPPSPSQEAVSLNYTPASSRSIKSDWCAMEFKDCPVFGISDLSEQSILSYALRVLCSKYLLTGKKRQIIPDTEIRVSIKHLSLVVLANILSVLPELFLQPLNLSSETECLDIDCDREQGKDLSLTLIPVTVPKEEQLLDIKEDHFGPVHSSVVVDYLTPLSRSVDGSSPSELFSVDPRMTHSDVCVSHGSQIKLRVKRIKQFRECEQFIYEVLLLHNHCDPMLRSDVIFIVQNLCKGISMANLTFDCFIAKWTRPVEFLELRFLCDIIVKGLKDEHHSVIKYAVSAIPTMVNFCMTSCPISSKEGIVVRLLCETLNVADGNPYWVTKNHLSEIAPNLDFALIGKACCDGNADHVKMRCYEMLMKFLRDEDQRIRVSAARGLIDLLATEGDGNQSGVDIQREYISEKVFASLAVPLNKLVKKNICCNPDDLRKLLFDLSDQLLDIGNKNSISGIFGVLRLVMELCPPVANYSIWSPFNILVILKDFLKENSLVIFDNFNHTEALRLHCELLAGKAVHEKVTIEELQFLLEHSLKMMNIFGHIVNNLKPLITHMQSKADLFTSDRELQKMQQKGYFGNKAVYLKVYKSIKVIHDTYKIDINAEVEERLRNLLRVNMSALNLVLELMPVVSISQSMKLVEEILSYLNVLFTWEPITVISTAKFLFKYFFERNFISRRDDYAWFLGSDEEARSVQEVIRRISEFNVMKPGEFYQEEESHIKLFENVVIKSLRIYMKSEPRDQSNILEFICQLLTLNVNYAMLDSNLEFFKFVQEQLDTIEGGRVKNAELLIENLIRFLFLLNNKKLINNPKIIHITDNLLANNNIRDCALRALTQLSDELFFNREAMLAQTGGEIVKEEGGANSAELSTEKEFIFTILMKFLNYKTIQGNVYLILNSHSAVKEYKTNTVEGILGMVEKYQMEGEVIEMEHVNELLRICGPKEVLEEIDRNQLREIMKRLTFEKQNFITDWRIFSALVEGIYSEFVETVEEDLLAEKWIQLYVNLIWEGRQWNGEEDLLKVYGENRVVTSYFGDSLRDLLKEKGDITFSLDEILQLRFNNPYLCLRVIEEFVDKGLIADYSAAIGKLNSGTDLDELVTKELLKIMLLAIEQGIISIADYEKIFIEKKELVIEIIGDQSSVIKTTVIFDFINLVSATKDRPVFLHCDVILLQCLEDMAEINTESDERILNILTGNIVEQKSSVIKKRAMELLFKIIERNNAENNIVHQKYPDLQGFDWYSLKKAPADLTRVTSYLSEKIDENWLWSQMKSNLSNSQHSKVQLDILLTMKSDLKVSNILTETEFSFPLFLDVIECSFRSIATVFQRDCIAYNPHVNYLKVPFVLRFFLEKHLDKYSDTHQLSTLRNSPEDLLWITKILTQFLMSCSHLEQIALKSIELRLWDKFMADHLLKPTTIDVIVEILFIIVDSPWGHFNDTERLECTLHFFHLAMENNYIFRMWNKVENYEKHFKKFVAFVDFLYRLLEVNLKNSSWLRDYKGIEGFFDRTQSDGKLVDLYEKLSLMIKLREEFSSRKRSSVDKSLEMICRIIHNIVRFNKIYPMAVIPHQYLRTVCDNLVLADPLKCPVPMMSIGDLKDSDTLIGYVANVKEIGFTSRQQFEEYLMTLLVLLNTEFDESEYDSQEQYVIRKTCFSSITELLVTIKEFPRIGLAKHDFVHTTRNDPIPIYMIHLKKLNEVLNAIPGCSPFASPNLERDATNPWNSQSQCHGFMEGQFNLPTIWDGLEDEEKQRESSPSGVRSLCLKNCAYNLEWFEIDYNSSVKMVLEMSMQTYEVYGETYLSFFLPCMVRLTDLFVTREQYKWLREIVYKLHEAVPHDDSNSHQYIVYLMCKTNAVLVPSTSDVNNLTQQVLPGYLKSKSPTILTASLKGILVLFESCVLHNSSIGGLNDEIQQLRRLILGYADRCLATEEAQLEGDLFEQHVKVLWATIFYTLEKTVKFVPECPLMNRIVVYLNKVLRSTNTLELFCCVVNGTGRLILTNCVSATDLDKIERIAMDLVKRNEMFAMPALKLLVQCIYIGSVDQLEKTQKSNGVVQDDPEIVLRLLEKIDVLFSKIKVSPPDIAEVYGQVLSLLIRDLIPAKDVLTKVIKEMIISQPHYKVVAQILHQVFRSSIDAAYLPLLQDWLVCSLSNFLNLPQAKSIWCLSVIFVSATLNVHLLKIFSHILSLKAESDGGQADPCLVHYFAVATQDFADKLTKSQKQVIVDCLTNSAHEIIQAVGRSL